MPTDAPPAGAQPPGSVAAPDRPLSLSTRAARTLATTTKSVPQAQGVTPRWLLRMLPWEEVPGATYRVNRRQVHTIGDGLITFTGTRDALSVMPGELRELPPLRDFADEDVLAELAGRLDRRDYGPGDAIVGMGQEADGVYLIAHGRAGRTGAGKYGETALGVLAGGQYFGEQVITGQAGRWEFTVRAATACTVLTLGRDALAEIAARTSLGAHLDGYRAGTARPRNSRGEARIELAAGHAGEPDLPGTFAAYDHQPPEHPLSVAQTVLRVHTRVADLYNSPMDQVEEQVRLTVEAMRERQEWELLNNPATGLLARVAPVQRIRTQAGPPAPDDMDNLLCRRRKTRFFLAHPKAIAAFGRECTQRGVYPATTQVEGQPFIAWRGVPVLPCASIPVAGDGSTSILAMRTGLKDQGVIGLHQTGHDGEREPGLTVRLRGIDAKGIMSYLVTANYGVAILVPDALGVLADVET